MESYEQILPALMHKYAIPGGAVAVVRDGKLIYARGFGYEDVDLDTLAIRNSHPLPEGYAARLRSGHQVRLLELQLCHSRPRDRAFERHAVRGVRARTRAAARGRPSHAPGQNAGS